MPYFSTVPQDLLCFLPDVLPASISLIILVGCTSPEELPSLGSYYDFMNRSWLASRRSYSRHALLPPGRNGRKPVKTLGTDGKLEDDDTTVTCKDIVSDIAGGFPASDNPEAALQTLFTHKHEIGSTKRK